MSQPPDIAGPAATPEVGEHEHRLAVAGMAQQSSQVVTTLTMLVVVTAVGRTLDLAEFGLYGLIVSIAGYMLIVQTSIEAVVVKSVAEARDSETARRAVSTALVLYAGFGLLVGVLLAAGGNAIVNLINMPDSLRDDARIGFVALGVVTLLGWPFKVFQDVLRGRQLFKYSALAEVAAYLTFGVGIVALLAAGAPLWALVLVGGSIPFFIGLWSRLMAGAARAWPGFSRRLVTRSEVRMFLGVSGFLFLSGLSTLIVFALDRVILGHFDSAAAVGLYEGPIRAHNFLAQLLSTLAVVALPATATFIGAGDRERSRDLLIRGTRYVLVAIVPVSVTLIVLGGPILEVWLGSRYREAGTALGILIGYQLLTASTALAGGMLVAAGQARLLARYSLLVAPLNLALALTLTPALGVEGIALAMAIPFVALFPLMMSWVIREYGVPVSDLVREAWLPGYGTGLVLAAALVAVRLAADPSGAAKVIPLCGVAVALYWAAYYVLWLSPRERLLVRGVALRITGRR